MGVPVLSSVSRRVPICSPQVDVATKDAQIKALQNQKLEIERKFGVPMSERQSGEGCFLPAPLRCVHHCSVLVRPCPPLSLASRLRPPRRLRRPDPRGARPAGAARRGARRAGGTRARAGRGAERPPPLPLQDADVLGPGHGAPRLVASPGGEGEELWGCRLEEGGRVTLRWMDGWCSSPNQWSCFFAIP